MIAFVEFQSIIFPQVFPTTHKQFIEAFHQTHNLHYKPTNEKKNKKIKSNPKHIIENTMKQDTQTNQTKPTNN